MNLKKLALVFPFVLAALLAVALPLRAQTGYGSYSETSILVLALVGGAGAIASTLTRVRIHR